jgi:hypothetical protein
VLGVKRPSGGRLEVLHPADEGSDRSGDERQDGRCFARTEIPVFLAVGYVIPGFIQGCFGVGQERQDFSGVEPRIAFGDIPGSTPRGIADLVEKPEVTANGFAFRQSQDFSTYLNRELVALEILKARDSSHPGWTCSPVAIVSSGNS